uniref:Uncharacterized protein n=1 Tax=viral metagenome TaxID=1070528 RepID=A0A6C0ER14_9ZZZZ
MSNQINSSSVSGGISNTPLKLFQPFNIIVWLSFYSPIILAVCMVSLSFVFQNFKGLIYLAFLIGICVVRSFVYSMSGSTPIVSDGTICTSVQYSKYGNPTFSAFVFAFTIMYLSLPMFSNGALNFWVFSGLLVYFFLDMFIKIYKKCTIQTGDLFLNVLLGLASSAFIVTMMYAGGSGKYLFFNEVSSNKEICSMPKKQTFKCNVFKNGELIGSV